MADESRSRGNEKRQGGRRGANAIEKSKEIATQSQDHQQEKNEGSHSRSGATQHQQRGGLYSAAKKGKAGGKRPVDSSRSRDLSATAESNFPKQDSSQRRDETGSEDGKRNDLGPDKRPSRSGGKSVGVNVVQIAHPKRSKKPAAWAEQQQQQQSKKKEARSKASQAAHRQQSERITSIRESANKEVGVVESGKQIQPGKQKSREELEAELAEKDFIFRIPVESRSEKFPDDEFYCRSCNLHVRSLGSCKNHIQQNKHKNNAKSRAELLALKDLPNPTNAQLQFLTHLLTQVYQKSGLHNAEDLTKRHEVFEQLATITNAAIPGSQLKLYGSTVSGFGMRDSDVNVFLQIAPDSKDDIPIVLKHVLAVINDHTDLYQDIQAKFNQTLPVITFVHRHSCLLCEVCAGQERKAVLTSSLLHHYACLDQRAAILGLCLRKWGQLCQLDDPSKGTLPAISFPLMAIFYLQQVEPPILPILQEMHSTAKTEGLCSTESAVDGNADDGNGEENADEEEEEEEAGEGTGGSLTLEDINAMKADNWKSENNESVGSLWLKMVKYYVVDKNIEQLVVCISKKGLVNRKSLGIGNRRLAIEDPVIPKKNLASGLNSQSVFNHFMLRLQQCLLYFSTPMAREPNDCKSKLTTSVVTGDDDISNLDTLVNQLVEHAITSALKLLRAEVATDAAAAVSRVTETDGHVKDPQNVAVLFKFDTSVFCDQDRPLPEWCCLCRQDGHQSDNCADETHPELPRLPRLSELAKQLLDQVCLEVRGDLAATKQHEDERNSVLREIHDCVAQEYPGCNLALFGSSENGFGFRNSDMDICLTHPEKTLDAVEVVTKLAKGMRARKHEYRDVLAIPTAKVPIVKFVHVASGMEGDISLDNILAQRNTQMLRFYSELDNRVKTLGYVIKCFAKISDIGDAARGSLSSYAYIVMLIYYLQRTRPPVIPCLQEIYEGEQPSVECEGWNCYFCSDKDTVKRLWGETKNKQSVGELWLGLLRFYTEEFDFSNMVVSPRRLEPLTKFDRSWVGRPMAIEDPFKLSHNLASGVGRKMKKFIFECFALARLQFGMPKQILQGEHLPAIFFHRRSLTPRVFSPNERSCRNCGEFGHFAKDCHNQGGKSKGLPRHAVTYAKLRKECAPQSASQQRLLHTDGQLVPLQHRVVAQPRTVSLPVGHQRPQLHLVSSQQLQPRPVTSVSHSVVYHPRPQPQPQLRQPIASQSWPQQPVASCHQRQAVGSPSKLRMSVSSHSQPAIPANVVRPAAAVAGPCTSTLQQQPVPGSPSSLLPQPGQSVQRLLAGLQSTTTASQLPHAVAVTASQRVVAHDAASPSAQQQQSVLDGCLRLTQPQQQSAQTLLQAGGHLASQIPHHPVNAPAPGPVVTASNAARQEDMLPKANDSVSFFDGWYVVYKRELTVLQAQEHQLVVQLQGHPMLQEYLKNNHAWQDYFKRCMSACQRECQMLQSQDSGLSTSSPTHVGLPRLPGTEFGRKQ